MLRDAASVGGGTTLRADVCIIGAGPAGMTVALELMQQRLGVIVLEAGGGEAAWRAPDLRGESEGWSYPELETTRRRGFGGTSLAWNLESQWSPDGGLRCHALDGLDFEKRSWVPNSGWPFGYEELGPYYARAHELIGLGDCAYSPDKLSGDAGVPMPLAGSRVETTLFRFADRNSFRDLRPKLVDSGDVTVYLNAQASEIETGPGPQQVSRVRVGGPRHQFWVEARLFVLAGGGIENARLLLLSNRTQPAGLGNGNDLVGRYFMEHLTQNAGHLEPDTPDFWQQIGLYRRTRLAGVPVLGALQPNEETRRQEGLSNVVLSPFVGRRVFFQRSVHSLSSIVYHLGLKHMPPHPLWQLKNILRDPLPPIVASYLRLTNRIGERDDFFGLRAHFEQAPDSENRVTLTGERDDLGLQRPKLTWRVGELEQRSLNTTISLADEALRAAGIGYVKDRPAESGFRRSVGITHHHMGTTRMHQDPKHGVVDADCRVHGIENLFVAGSSVMPTGGAATVTLTLVALAIRLADRVKRELAEGTGRVSVAPAEAAERG